MKKIVLKYLVELIIVAFGVFLGMYVSEWRSKQSDQENASKALTYIIQELEENQKSLGYSAVYHDTIRVNLEKITQTIAEEEFEKPYFRSEVFHITKINKWTGIGLPKFATVSYESAKINGVFQELDVEIVQLIAGVYKQIINNQELGKSTVDKLMQSDSSTKVVDVIGVVELLTSDVLVSEYLLAIELKNVIKELKEYQSG